MSEVETFVAVNLIRSRVDALKYISSLGWATGFEFVQAMGVTPFEVFEETYVMKAIQFVPVLPIVIAGINVPIATLDGSKIRYSTCTLFRDAQDYVFVRAGVFCSTLPGVAPAPTPELEIENDVNIDA